MANRIIKHISAKVNGGSVAETFDLCDARTNFGLKKLMHNAHAGAEDLAPANSVYAIQWAKNVGYDTCELDVRKASDGWIICHNATTTDFTGQNYTVRNTTVATLTSLNITKGTYLSKYATGTVKVMSLDTAITTCMICGIIPMIELKDDDLTASEVQAFYDVINSYGITNACMIKCFYESTVDKLMEIDQSLKVLYLIEDSSTLATAINKDCYGVSIRYDLLCDGNTSSTTYQQGAQIVANYHAAGKFVDVWTISASLTGTNLIVKRLIDMHVDMLTLSHYCYWTYSDNENLDNIAGSYPIGYVDNLPIFVPVEKEIISRGSFLNRDFKGGTTIWHDNMCRNYRKDRAMTIGKIPVRPGSVVRVTVPKPIVCAILGWGGTTLLRVADSGWLNDGSTDTTVSYTFSSSLSNLAFASISLKRDDIGIIDYRDENDIFKSITVVMP